MRFAPAQIALALRHERRIGPRTSGVSPAYRGLSTHSSARRPSLRWHTAGSRSDRDPRPRVERLLYSSPFYARTRMPRPDGRNAADLRPITFQRGFTNRAPGSVLASFG